MRQRPAEPERRSEKARAFGLYASATILLPLLLILPFAFVLGGADEPKQPNGPLTPEASLRSIRARPGFEVELVAAEPLIESPVAFDWGADGKLWVVEMRDYPLGMDNKGKPGGRIVCLEDTDGDGRYDKSTVFLDGLLFPTGVMSWGK